MHDKEPFRCRLLAVVEEVSVRIKDLLRRVLRLFKRVSPEKETMDYCFAHGFQAGKNFHYNSGFPIDSNFPWLISVGDNVTVATGVKLLAHDASTALVGTHTKIGIVRIGNNVFIGANSIVLCNTRIGDNVIVGAGSVVTQDIPSNSVYAGNPARFVCPFEDFKDRHLFARETHPVFSEHRWQEWPTASKEEHDQMREKLKDTYGFL